MEDYVEPSIETIKTWELYTIIYNQVRVSPTGEIIGLDLTAVICTLGLYISDEQERADMLERMVFIWNLRREVS
jgi:hypothetical protein